MSFLDSLTSEVRNATCGWLSLQDNLNRWGQDALAGLVTRTTGGFITPVRLPNPAGFWYSLLCNRQPPPPPPPPFPGGQCDGVGYRVEVDNARYTVGCVRASDLTGSVDVWGPILAVRLVPADPLPSNKQHRLLVDCRGKFSDPIGPIQTVDAGSRSNLTSQDCPSPFITDIRVIRLDGNPDNCGDPPEFIPIPFPRPAPIIIAPSFNWVDIDNNVQVQPSFRIRINRPNLTFAPRFNIPVSVDLGNPSGAAPGTFAPTVNFNFGLSGEVNISIDNSTQLPPENPDDEIPDPNPIPVPKPPRPPKETEDSFTILYGVLVTARQVDPSRVTIVELNGSPSLYAPDAGTVNFVYQVGESTVYGRPLRVQAGKQVLYVDNEFEATGFSVQARPGWDIEDFALTRPIPVEEVIRNGYANLLG